MNGKRDKVTSWRPSRTLSQQQTTRLCKETTTTTWRREAQSSGGSFWVSHTGRHRPCWSVSYTCTRNWCALSLFSLWNKGGQDYSFSRYLWKFSSQVHVSEERIRFVFIRSRLQRIIFELLRIGGGGNRRGGNKEWGANRRRLCTQWLRSFGEKQTSAQSLVKRMKKKSN
jgi:hypothetical protein